MKNRLSIFAIIFLVILVFTSCDDPELNFNDFSKKYIWEKDELSVKFEQVHKLESNFNEYENSYKFYSIWQSMNNLVSLYDKIYDNRKNQPSYGEKYFGNIAFPQYKDLEFLQKLYDNDPDKYSFCEPLLNIYKYVGNNNLSEDDISKIKEVILYAIDYYYDTK